MKRLVSIVCVVLISAAIPIHIVANCDHDRTFVDCSVLLSENCPRCNLSGTQPACTETAEIYEGTSPYVLTQVGNNLGDYTDLGNPTTVKCSAEYECDQKQQANYTCDLNMSTFINECSTPDVTRNCWYCESGEEIALSANTYDVKTIDDLGCGGG